MKTDYTEEIKNIIKENYEPVDSPMKESEFTERNSLGSICRILIQVLPKEWIYESDVYNVLEELGFKKFLLDEEVESENEEGEPEIRTYKVMAYLMERKTLSV